MAKFQLTKVITTEINQIAASPNSHLIVQGANYLYFSMQPTQEIVTFKEICRRPNIKCYAVRNFKGATIGYTVLLAQKPLELKMDEFGAAIFFSPLGKAKDLKKSNLQYKRLQVPFSDAKFRIISFDSKDFFVSVKWKSNNPVDLN
jgi:hypothetical protein